MSMYLHKNLLPCEIYKPNSWGHQREPKLESPNMSTRNNGMEGSLVRGQPYFLQFVSFSDPLQSLSKWKTKMIGSRKFIHERKLDG